MVSVLKANTDLTKTWNTWLVWTSRIMIFGQWYLISMRLRICNDTTVELLVKFSYKETAFAQLRMLHSRKSLHS